MLLALDMPQAALQAASKAVEQAYLVLFSHYQALTTLEQHKQAQAAIKQAYQMLDRALQGLSPEQR